MEGVIKRYLFVSRNVKIENLPYNHIKTSKDCYDLIKSIYLEEGLSIDLFEYSLAIYLDKKFKVLGYMKIGEGGLRYVYCDIRKIMIGALESFCHGLIFIHNHPSGLTNPSEEDKKLTKQIENACKVMDIQLMDHIIIAKDSYFSFNDNKLLNT